MHTHTHIAVFHYQVSQLVAQLFQMRAQMQKLMGVMTGQEALPGMGNLMESLNADEKVII